MDKPLFELHTYYRSSCAARLRIALNYKGISYTSECVDMSTKQHESEGYLAKNPSGTVPMLKDLRAEPPGSPGFQIVQSIAALEYLEEAVADVCPLLPASPSKRANVRVLVNVIASDTQPLTGRSFLKEITDTEKEYDEWMKKYMTRGLQAYESIVGKTAGRFSVGEDFTMADVCLIPQVWNAVHYGVDMEQLPLITGICKRASELDAVKKAHWSVQPDTPKDLAWI